MRPTDVPDTGKLHSNQNFPVSNKHTMLYHKYDTSIDYNKIKFEILGLLCDLLWSDPDKDVQGWGENDRGVSFTFGADVVSKFLNRHDLDLICRAHQV